MRENKGFNVAAVYSCQSEAFAECETEPHKLQNMWADLNILNNKKKKAHLGNNTRKALKLTVSREIGGKRVSG